MIYYAAYVAEWNGPVIYMSNQTGCRRRTLEDVYNVYTERNGYVLARRGIEAAVMCPNHPDHIINPEKIIDIIEAMYHGRLNVRVITIEEGDEIVEVL